MSKKRTKQQKIRAKYHYAFPVSRSFSGIKSGDEEQAKPQARIFEKANDVSSLYAYDPHLTRLDIRHTLLISGVILVLQLILYWWWK